MKDRKLIVFGILWILGVFAILAVAESASAASPRLLFSHACEFGTGQSSLQVHFLLQDPPVGVTDWGSVQFTLIRPNGSPLSGTAPFDKIVSNNAHYLTNISGTFPVGTYTVTLATLTITGTFGTQTFTLSNPGPKSVGGCTPTAVTLSDFRASKTTIGAVSEDHILLPIVLAVLGLVVLASLTIVFSRR